MRASNSRSEIPRPAGRASGSLPPPESYRLPTPLWCSPAPSAVSGRTSGRTCCPSDRIPFRCLRSLTGSSSRSLHIHSGSLTPEFRAADLMASSCLRHSSNVRSRRSISSRASTTRSGSWLSITSFNATTAARSSPYAQSALAVKSRNPLARLPLFSHWSLHAAFNPSAIVLSSSSFLACTW